MTTAQQPTRDSILANLGKLRETTEAQATVEGDYAPAFTPKTIQPKPTTFRKGGLMDMAEDASTSEQSKELTDFIGTVSMMDAIKKWGKPQSGYKSTGPQGILIRCPKPEHVDKNPSCSVELGKGLFHCFSCDAQGDKYTLAAIHYGLDLGTYQQGHNFVELKEKMAMDLGYTVYESAGVKMVQAPQAPQAPTSAPVMPANPAPSTIIKLDDGSYLDQSTGELVDAPVRPQPVQFTGGVFGDNAVANPEPVQSRPTPVNLAEFIDADESDSNVKPVLDWIPLGKNRSFIDQYMSCASQKPYPEVFGFAGALICLGFVGNRDIRLKSVKPIHSGIGFVTVADSGVGKSEALRDAQEILGKVMPWRNAELAIGTGGQVVPVSGVKDVLGSASGEDLIKQFQDVVQIPNGQNGDGSTHFEEERYPVNGLISYEELETLIDKSVARGATTKKRLMAFLDGAPKLNNSSITNGKIEAVHPFSMLYTSVPTKTVNNLLTDRDSSSGFINRLAFFVGERKFWDPRNMEIVDMSPAENALRELKEFWDTQGPTIIDYDHDGKEAMANYILNVSNKLQHSDDSMMGRLDMMFWKIIVLICINEKSKIATEDIVNKAINLHQYFISTYKFVSREVYDPITNPQASDLDDRVLKRIINVMAKKKAQGKELPEEYAVFATEVRKSVERHLDKPGRTKSQVLGQALKALVDIGEIKSVNTASGIAYYKD